MEEKYLTYKATFEEESFQTLNSEFKKGKCDVMIFGENLNGSIISKEATEKAANSIYNIPVIAEYFQEKNDGDGDYGTHGGKIIIDSEGIEFIQTTKAYGVVPESCNWRIEEKDGNDMLVVDVIMWAGRFDELQTLVKEKARPQSMEIRVKESHFNSDGKLVIDNFEFSALCILGSDVQPAMPNSELILFSNKKSIDDYMSNNDDYVDIVKKYNMYMNENSEKGGAEDLSKKEELKDNLEFEQEAENEEVLEEKLETNEVDIKEEVEEVEKFEEDNLEESSEKEEEGEDFESKPDTEEQDNEEKEEDELFEENVNNNSNGETESEENTDNEEFSITYKDLRETLSNSISGEWTDDQNHYYTWVMDFSDEYVYVSEYGVMDGKYYDIYKRYEYSLSESNEVTITDFSIQVFTKWLTQEQIDTIESETEGFVTKIKDLEATNELLTEENDSLKEFVKEVEEETKKEEVSTILDEFSEKLSKLEGFISLKEKAFDMDAEEVEKECWVLVGKANFKRKPKSESKTKRIIAGQFTETETKSKNVYGKYEKDIIK